MSTEPTPVRPAGDRPTESAPSKTVRFGGTFKLAAVIASAITVAACSVHGATPSAPSYESIAGTTTQRATSSPIAHVVFVIQENRSFNNLFMGYPGAYTSTYGYSLYHKKITLHSQGLVQGWDLEHDSYSFFDDCNAPKGKLPGTDCKMDGWNKEMAGLGAPKDFAYAYVPHDEIEPYWTIAKRYVLADHMFQSNLDGSFIAHQYAVAAFASHAVNSPATDWGCEGGKTDTLPTLTQQRTLGKNIVACFDNATLGGSADKAGLTWRFYTGSIYGDGGLWSAYQADRQIYYGSDWDADVVNPPAQFLKDVAKGELASITWVTPTYAASDHAALNTGEGPAWIASIVNAIGKSQFWDSTAIFIMWDDWGGWFDPMPPVLEDYDGLGFRVPMLIVSPYAKHGYVTHIQYETASILKYIEDNFGLPPLAAADKRANDPATDAFDYSAPPRPFKKIPGGKSASYWMHLDQTWHGHGWPTNIIGDD
jgi:phospholipase C